MSGKGTGPMKRALVLLLAAATFGGAGCLRRQCSCGNGTNGPGALRPHGLALHRDDGGLFGRHKHGGDAEEGPDGPSTAAVGYPYYTIRGPRDFFADNPPSIGR